jgi:hypothetical protein
VQWVLGYPSASRVPTRFDSRKPEWLPGTSTPLLYNENVRTSPVRIDSALYQICYAKNFPAVKYDLDRNCYFDTPGQQIGRPERGCVVNLRACVAGADLRFIAVISFIRL